MAVAGIGIKRDVPRLLRARDDAVDRPARHAGQAGDRLLHPLPLDHEQGPDQIGRRQDGFGVEPAAPVTRTGATKAKRGVGCGHGFGFAGS
ncbi:hypothetical protein WR25_12771 [Diploscapter pachys]|uniref:Uncharacterized protein n=1 Tax=Diploscapter pachys TaxID=2018661 RepID=A0A2A2K7F0_9BILA|nr:hypothetical protein WR25_12771 [Diploscapter pachys]